MQCDPTGVNPFQYEIGKTYEESSAELCDHGFHACSAPLEVFGYYAPGDGSRYCEVELDGLTEEAREDSKRCGTKITVGAEIGIPGLVKAHVEYVKEHIDQHKEQQKMTGNYSAATNTGNRSAATNTGDYSAATNTGNRSAATNTGDYSAATNTGNRSAATNTGDYSAATNTGNRSAATNTGDYSAATNTGDYSAAEVSGKDSVAIVTGYRSKAKGAIGCWLVLTERNDEMKIVNMMCVKVDGETVKADTWYKLENGKPVEV